MTQVGKAESIFDKLGIDISDKRMRVLASILVLEEEVGTMFSFEEIYKKLREIEGKHPGKKPLIYRYLTTLEESGFIEINRYGYRHEYRSDFHRIQRAFENIKKTRIRDLEEKRNGLRDLKDFLLKIDLNDLSSTLIQDLTGSKPQMKPRYALGPENVYWLIDREIYAKAGSGDIIRFVLDWVNPEMEAKLNRQEWGDQLLSKNIEIKTLLQKESLMDDSVYARRATPYREWKKKGWKIGVRIRLDSSKSYQFASLNEDGIVLIVAENPLTATWIPRETNPSLVQDAIERFDLDFENSFDPESIFSDRG